MKMECNVGKTDRRIRGVLVLILAYVAYVYNLWWVYAIALILLITVLMSRCGPYYIFGINTCKVEKKKVNTAVKKAVKKTSKPKAKSKPKQK